MKLAISMAVLAVSAAFLPSCTASEKNSGATPSARDAKAVVPQDARSDAPIAYSAVQSDPDRYAGKQVTWIGAVISSTITAEAITNFWKVEGGGNDAVFATIQDDEQLTDAAKARGKVRFDFTRKVTGTISQDQAEYKAGTDSVKVPLLTKVVITHGVADCRYGSTGTPISSTSVVKTS
jgi:hypothetical protein